MNNLFLIIVNSEGNKCSHVKNSSPKMIESMKEHCNKLKEMFNNEYKVVRLIKTSKGYKKV
jgi:hypothetical protein